MANASEKISLLEKIMEAAVRSNKHSSDVLKAFRPVLVKKVDLVESLELSDDETLNLDESRFKEGIPLSRQNDLVPGSDACRTIALSLIPAISKGFPDMKPEMEKLESLIGKKTIDLSEYLAATPEKGEELIEQWSSDHNVAPYASAFLTRTVLRVYFAKKALNWAELIKGFAWEKGYCPICGSPPMIAKVREGITSRWLHCSCCGHEWVFSRVVCPACENTEQKEMTYFFVEDKDKDKETTFVCEKCKQYLITVTKVNDLAGIDADVSAISLVHLDVLMQGKGYKPMAECDWNMFP